MKIYDQMIQQMKRELLEYYKNRKAITIHEKRLEKLYASLKSIQEDIDSSKFNYCLETDLKGISYDGVMVMGGSLPTSNMDNEIERIYKNLERDRQHTLQEILDTKALIRKLENKCSEMEIYLNMLSDESCQLLQLKYQEGNSIYQLSCIFNVSEATISRNIKDIFYDFVKLKMYYQKP